jgi:hypothetical protein
MRSYFTASTLLLLVVLFTSCSKKMNFSKSVIAPGAHGSVGVKKDKNDNYIMSVNVINLPDSKDLTPPKNAYVVWMETNGATAKNIGQIKSKSPFLSKAMKASLTAASTTAPTKIFITAEDDPNATYPGQEVLTTN